MILVGISSRFGGPCYLNDQIVLPTPSVWSLKLGDPMRSVWRWWCPSSVLHHCAAAQGGDVRPQSPGRHSGLVVLTVGL